MLLRILNLYFKNSNPRDFFDSLSQNRTFSASIRSLGLLYASVELVAQFWGIDRCANGDDLGPRRTFAPLVQFGYLGAASHDLKGVTFTGKVGSIDDALTAVN